MWKLPPKFVGAYAEQRRCHDAQALGETSIEISSQDLNHIFELETRLIPLMVDMRARGVRVDLDKADIVREN